MRELVLLAKLLRPGGVRAVAAESLLLKHQILISHRSRQRAPSLTSLDRVVLGLTTLFVSPRRIPKLGALVKPATLLKFHKSLVDRKYRLLFSSSSHRRKPGPKGPSAELIAAIVEMKRRNPRFGCMRIAQQISYTFGVQIDKDTVRRVLAKHYRPGDSGSSVLSAWWKRGCEVLRWRIANWITSASHCRTGPNRGGKEMSGYPMQRAPRCGAKTRQGDPVEAFRRAWLPFQGK